MISVTWKRNGCILQWHSDNLLGMRSTSIAGSVGTPLQMVNYGLWSRVSDLTIGQSLYFRLGKPTKTLNHPSLFLIDLSYGQHFNLDLLTRLLDFDQIREVRWHFSRHCEHIHQHKDTTPVHCSLFVSFLNLWDIHRECFNLLVNCSDPSQGLERRGLGTVRSPAGTMVWTIGFIIRAIRRIWPGLAVPHGADNKNGLDYREGQMGRRAPLCSGLRL